MKIKLNPRYDNWYTIIRAEHDDKTWWEEKSANTSTWMMSERLEPASCIEGEGWEMLELAKAIKARTEIYFKRCAVRADSKGIYFWSPKNSRVETLISFEDADEFANEVVETLK